MKGGILSNPVICIFMVVCLLGLGWRPCSVRATDLKNEFWRIEYFGQPYGVKPGGTIHYQLRITRLGPPVDNPQFGVHRDGASTTRFTGFSLPPSQGSETALDVRWKFNGTMKPGDIWEVRFDVRVKSRLKAGARFASFAEAFGGEGAAVAGKGQPGFDHGSADVYNSIPRITDFGDPEYFANSTEPVHLGTGDYYTDALVDIDLGGPLPLMFSRRYAANLKDEERVDSALGGNWMHNFDPRLIVIDPAFVEAVYRGGKVIPMVKDFYSPAGWTTNSREAVGYQLRDDGNSFWLMDPLRERVFRFAKGSGRLLSIQDRQGNRLSLLYDEQDRLMEVRDGLGRTLTFSYDRQGHLTGVTGGQRNLVYGYTSRRRQSLLTSFTDAEGNTTMYTYDQGTTEHGPLMTVRQQPAGNQPYTQTYNQQGQVVEQQDAYGHTTTFEYDTPAAGQTRVTDADGVWEVTHQNQRWLIRFQDRAGKSATFEYDEFGRRTLITDRLGDTTRLSYHPETGKLASYTDAEGNTTRFSYTPQDQTFTNPDSGETVTFRFYNLTRIDYADGSNERFTYDERGNVLTWVDRAGKSWSFAYNQRGQVLTVTNPTGGVVTNSYNADGTLASRTDSDTGVTTFTYDDFRRLITITRPDGAPVGFSYDLNDRLLSVTDERGQTTRFSYDANGNLATVRNPLNQITTFTYDLMDRVIGRTDPLGQRSAYAYDALGRLVSVTDRNEHTTTFTYNSLGEQTSLIDPARQTWTTAYDDEGVPAAFSTPLGFITAFQTDKLGRTTRATDPLGAQAEFIYDALGRLASAIDPEGRQTTYTYDAAGRLAGVTRPVIGTATYTRNDLGRLTHINDLRDQRWEFERSPMGQLTSHTDPLGNWRSYAYDTRGRIRQISYSGGGTASFTYDAAGNVTRIVFSGGPTLDYTYDEAGRLLMANDLGLTYDARGDIINSQDGASSFGATYDAGRRLATVSYDGRATVTYTYDARDRLTRVSDSLSGTWVTFSYDADGRLIEIRRSNGVSTAYSYDQAGQLTRIQDGVLADQQYRLNAKGEPLHAVMSVPLASSNISYTYDDAGRLTKADYGDGNRLAYTYDAAGNLLSRTGQTPLDPAPRTDSLRFDDASQISSPGYTYDARGRQTAGPGRAFTYDRATRLTSIVAGGRTASFTYNGLGDLRTRTVGGTTTSYYHNYAIGLAPIVAEFVESGGGSRKRETGEQKSAIRNPIQRTALIAIPRRFYIYTPSGSLLYSIDAVTNQVRFYHFDRVGSTLYLTNGGGAVTDAYAYTPYGRLLGHTGASDQPFTYVGQFGVRWEPVGGLYHMRARYYDPVTARFLSRDPVWPVLADPASLNPYQYTTQNPISFIDPSGAFIELPIKRDDDPDDPDRKPYSITRLSDIPEIVDEAVRTTTFWQALTGQAGRNIDQGRRYFWVKNVGWIDLQHVVSSALGPANRFNATYATFGLAMEWRQYFSKEAAKSAFKEEDLRSNELGNIAYARADRTTGQSLGESVRTLIEQMAQESRPPSPSLVGSLVGLGINGLLTYSLVKQFAQQNPVEADGATGPNSTTGGVWSGWRQLLGKFLGQ